jgi:TRAP-type C4-dicarboxylate transport system permease large subunit
VWSRRCCCFPLVIGGLYLGWFTPTEAGAAGAFGALAIGLVQRSLDFKGIVQSIVESVRISAMVVLLITGAVLFGRFLTVSRLPFELAEWAAALPVAPFVILLVVLGIYLAGGMLMDALGFLVVTIPIFFPLGVALGYDPVWYTVILTVVTTHGCRDAAGGRQCLHRAWPRAGDTDPHHLPRRDVFHDLVRAVHPDDVGLPRSQ